MDACTAGKVSGKLGGLADGVGGGVPLSLGKLRLGQVDAVEGAVAGVSGAGGGERGVGVGLGVLGLAQNTQRFAVEGVEVGCAVEA
ncbi:hypothetical protein [Streptomyces telluris]|uniref:Uncharacterized protein n=1 Tax=Streptomyces telluris TaxID=2720021 RepID=A0A9X2RNK9_9ACTN|nr:hypothetical protein [Streptomyces telluris]MCQ8772109.1 hypothetical protein [Streptomyces telluris]NJP80160.1 hypothetical protein [Streptomyces telluris]